MRTNNIFKRYLLLLVVNLTLVTSTIAASYSFSKENNEGVTIYYKIDGDNVSVVSGDEKYSGNIIIPETVSYENKTYHVTSISSSTFYKCVNLLSVSLPATITKIGSSAFKGCTLIKSFVIPDYVNNIDQMAFSGCSNLTDITLPHGITAIETMTFLGCTNLENVDLPNTLKSIGESAFSMCKSLKKIAIPDSVLTIGSRAFYNCSALEEVQLGASLLSIGTNAFDSDRSIKSIISYIKTPFAISDVWDNDHFGIMTSATLYVPFGTKSLYQSTSGWEFTNIVEMEETLALLPQVVWCENNTTLYFLASKDSLKIGELYEGLPISQVWIGSEVISPSSPSLSYPVWYSTVKDNLTQVVFEESFKDIRPQQTALWFAQCKSLLSIVGLKNLNTSKINNMAGMFLNCNNLSSLNLSLFDTRNVKNMNAMFYGCYSLKNLDLSAFDTQIVYNMSNMFYDCKGLKNLDLSSFDTRNVKETERMFYRCSELESLDLSFLDVTNDTTAYCMFAYCTKLRNINIANWNTSNMVNMRAMFLECNNLKDVDLTSFDLSKVTTTALMFGNCKQLENLDLSSFNTYNVEHMDSMFYGCSSLKTIFVGDCWNTAKVTTHADMFQGCHNIVGGNGTTYNSSYTNVTYARIDEEGAPGYFSIKERPSVVKLTLPSDLIAFSSNNDIDFSGTNDLKAYIASGFNPNTGEVIMLRVYNVPANTGLLLKGTQGGSYEIPIQPTDFIYSNFLKAVTVDTEITNGYILSDGQFVKVNENKMVTAGSAYLNLPETAQNRFSIVFKESDEGTDSPTGFIPINGHNTESRKWYSIQGTVVNGKPAKPGIYVQNGHKIVIK